MANRYWVGGTGTWNPASTSWSTTSGGSPGSAAPLSTDNAIFDANSGGGIVTVEDGGGGSGNPPECASLICTGFTGSIDSSGNQIFVNGNVTLSSGGDYTALWVEIISGSSTLTSVGKSIYQIATEVGTTVTLADDLVNVSNGLFVSGTFTTNNFNVTATSVFTSVSVYGTLNMGSSTFTVSGTWYVDTAATINAGTSTINLTNTATDFYGGNQTYYNLNIGNTVSLSGNNTFNTISNSTQPITINFAAGSTQTVTNFSVSGTAGNLVTLQSITSGTQFTLSKASGTVSRDYLSIKDSAATGGAAWYAGANSTNVSNNTGWTFTAPPPNRYWVGGTGTWDATDTTNWSDTSGGSGGFSVPTSADDVFIDANSGGGTITVTSDVFGANVNFTGFTGSIVTSSIFFLYLSGNLTLGAAGIYGIWNEEFRVVIESNSTMVSNNTTNPYLLILVQYGGVLTLGDDLEISSLEIISDTVSSSTLNTNNYNVTVSNFDAFGLYPSTINLGSSSLTLSSFYVDSSVIVDAGTSTINMDYAVFGGDYNWEFYGGGHTYYNLNFSSGSDAIGGGGIYDDSTFYNITNSAQVDGVGFAAGTTQTITGTFGVSGTAGYPFTIRCIDFGSQFTLSKASGTVSCDYLSITDSVATGGAAWYAGANSTNVSNNTGWIFTAPPSPGGQTVVIGAGISLGAGVSIT